MGEGETAAWRRRARAMGVNGEWGERSWRVRWVKNFWDNNDGLKPSTPYRY